MARRRKKSIEDVVAERIRVERERQGLSQAELARRSGVSQSNLTRLENGGRACTISTLTKLAHGLGMKPAELLGSRLDPPKPTRAEKAFFRVCEKLRDRDADYLRAVEDVIKALDRVSR